jgi:hypothetical protein
MSAATRPSRSVEAMSQVLAYLVTERQSLRARDASTVELEANRQAIVAMQWHLNRALAAAHGAPPATVRVAS